MMLSTSQSLVKLDIDSNDVPNVGRLTKLCYRAGVRIEWLSQSRSPGGRGWHIVISVSPRPRTAMEVVALQAVLGGDPFREACQVQRARVFRQAPAWMRDRWNVLYVPSGVRSRHLNLRRVNAINRTRERRRRTGRGGSREVSQE